MGCSPPHPHSVADDSPSCPCQRASRLSSSRTVVVISWLGDDIGRRYHSALSNRAALPNLTLAPVPTRCRRTFLRVADDPLGGTTYQVREYVLASRHPWRMAICAAQTVPGRRATITVFGALCAV